MPSFIPSSSYNIKLRNNLDLNLSEGEFYFQKTDFENFTANLSECSKVMNDLPRKSYKCFEYTKKNDIWFFYIDKKQGHVTYRLVPLEFLKK